MTRNTQLNRFIVKDCLTVLLVSLSACVVVSPQPVPTYLRNCSKFNWLCVNSTHAQQCDAAHFKLGRVFQCEEGQLCQAYSESGCAPSRPKAQRRSNTSSRFMCPAAGIFSDPNPCSSTYYVCIDSERSGYDKSELACPMGFVYDEDNDMCKRHPIYCLNYKKASHDSHAHGN